jgi:hypothetical protein
MDRREQPALISRCRAQDRDPTLSIAELSGGTRILEGTLRTGRQKLLRDPHWRPHRHHCGCHQRMVSHLQEKDLNDTVKNAFLSKGY